MGDAILVLNAGLRRSSFSVFSGDLAPGPHGQVEGIGSKPRLVVSGQAEVAHEPAATTDHAGAIHLIHDWLVAHHAGEHELAAVGHRVVHGGMRFERPVRIDAGVLKGIEELVPLAPLHQPPALAGIRAMSEAAPALPQYACFDTSFHRGQPALAQMSPLPRRWTDEGVRRYGFPRISYGVHCVRDCRRRLRRGAWWWRISATRQHVRDAGGQKRRHTMAIYRAGWIGDGDPQRAIDPGVLLYLCSSVH